MLFTGKSDDQRQGITPSRSDVSWKIPLFRGEEGKVQRTLEMVGMTTGTFPRKGRRTCRISELRLGTLGFEEMTRMQKKKKEEGPAYPLI